jgi:hypothetical protein
LSAGWLEELLYLIIGLLITFDFAKKQQIGSRNLINSLKKEVLWL